jgi:CHAT domain-containing protein/tetratricopeptide (TPR) repeat protein
MVADILSVRGRRELECARCGVRNHSYWAVVDSLEHPDVVRDETKLSAAVCDTCGLHRRHHFPMTILRRAPAADYILVMDSMASPDALEQLFETVSFNVARASLHLDMIPIVVRHYSLNSVAAGEAFGIYQAGNASSGDPITKYGLETTELLNAILIRDFERLCREAFDRILSCTSVEALDNEVASHNEFWTQQEFKSKVAAIAREIGETDRAESVPWQELSEAIEAIGTDRQPTMWIAYEQARAKAIAALDIEKLERIAHDPTKAVADRRRAAEQLVHYFSALGDKTTQAHALHLRAEVVWTGGISKEGERRAAESDLRDAILLFHEEGDRLSEARCRVALASLSLNLRRSESIDIYTGAAHELRAATRIFEELGDNDAAINALGNLGVVLARIVKLEGSHDYTESIAYLTKAVDYREEAGGVDLAYSLGQRGAMRLNHANENTDAGMLRAALADLNKAAEIAGSVGHDRNLLAQVCEDLTELILSPLAESLFGSSDERLKTALRIAEQVVTNRLDKTLRTGDLLRLGRIQAQLNDNLGTLRTLEEAVAQADPDTDLERWRQAHFELASAQTVAEDWLGAATHFEIVALTGRTGTTELSPSSRAGRWAAYCYVRAGDVLRAVEALESSLCQELSNDKRHLILGAQGVEAVDASLSAAYRAAVANLANAGERKQEELQRLTSEIRRLNPSFLRRVPVALFGRSASPSRPIVYVLPSPSGTAILFLTGPNGSDIKAQLCPDITSEYVAQMTRGFSELVRGPGIMLARTQREHQAALELCLPVIGAEIMSHVANELANMRASEACLIPTGLLTMFPLHAAPFDVNGQSQCIYDVMPISYLPSATLGYVTTAVIGGKDLRRDLLVAAGDSRVEGLPPLPGARREILAAVHAWDGEAAAALGANATWDFLANAIRPGCHVHLSVHASNIGASNGSIEPWFEFSDGRASASALSELLAQNGVVSVFAAGCETGAIDISQDLDQNVSLASRLLGTSCTHVVTALWQLPDQATSLLVERYYINVHTQGLSQSEALREATNWMRGLSGADVRRIERRERIRERQAGHSDDESFANLRGVRKFVTRDMPRNRFRAGDVLHRRRPFGHPQIWAALQLFGYEVGVGA